jgi:hypothetical protein
MKMAWAIKGITKKMWDDENSDVMATGQKIAEIHKKAEELGVRQELLDYLEYTSKAREMEMDYGMRHGHNEPMLKLKDFKKGGRRRSRVWAANEPMKKEGLYNTNGGKQQGWEVQNQGQVRRLPGEGPGVNGGRAQSQELDSMDQPQYEAAYPNDPDACQTCHGRGWDFTGDCEDCAGTGLRNMMWCPACKGMGVQVTGPGMEDDSPDQYCPECKGSGAVSQFNGVDDEDTGFSVKEMFAVEGVEEGVEGMKRSVKDMKHAVSKLKKSSEKEKKEHPWATKKQAMQIAKDHEKLGEIKSVFVMKESPQVLRPGDWYEAVQFHQLDGTHADDVSLRGAGHRVSPNSKPMKGYVVYEVQADGTLKARAANWDSGD